LNVQYCEKRSADKRGKQHPFHDGDFSALR
jgi:hypothetical protein